MLNNKEASESNSLSTISKLAISYISCFPIDWYKRVSIHWNPKNKPNKDIIFAISPMQNHTTNVDFVKACLVKHFIIISFSQTKFLVQLNDVLDNMVPHNVNPVEGSRAESTQISRSAIILTVVLLEYVNDPLGCYCVFEKEKCNVKHFVKEYIYPFYFKQPKRFICLKRKRKSRMKPV
jgi:hypothetical protein